MEKISFFLLLYGYNVRLAATYTLTTNWKRKYFNTVIIRLPYRNYMAYAAHLLLEGILLVNLRAFAILNPSGIKNNDVLFIFDGCSTLYDKTCQISYCVVQIYNIIFLH